MNMASWLVSHGLQGLQCLENQRDEGKISMDASRDVYLTCSMNNSIFALSELFGMRINSISSQCSIQT